MVEVASPVDIAYQYEMWIGRTVASVLEWTQVFGLESLPFPEQQPEEVDVTHMQSPGRTRETIPGLIGVVDASVEKQRWGADDGDILLDELAGLTASGAREDVLIEFNTGGAAPEVRRTYRGYINSYTPTGTVGDKEMCAVSMKIFELQATNARVIV